jgi:hypothetical protein
VTDQYAEVIPARIEVSVVRTRTARAAATAIAIAGLFAACSHNGDASEFPVGVYVHPGSTETTGSIEFKSDGSWIELGSSWDRTTTW